MFSIRETKSALRYGRERAFGWSSRAAATAGTRREAQPLLPDQPGDVQELLALGDLVPPLAGGDQEDQRAQDHEVLRRGCPRAGASKARFGSRSARTAEICGASSHFHRTGIRCMKGNDHVDVERYARQDAARVRFEDVDQIGKTV